MPLYVYECRSCQAQSEKLRSRDNRRKTLVCPSCGGTMEYRAVVPVNWSYGKKRKIGTRAGYG